MDKPNDTVQILNERHYSLSFIQDFSSGSIDDFKPADYLPDYNGRPQTLRYMTEENQPCLYIETEGQKKKRHGFVLAENIQLQSNMAVEIKVKPIGDSEAIFELWLTGANGGGWLSFTLFGGYYGFRKETIINFNGESVHLPDKLWDFGNWYYLYIQLNTDKTIMALLNENRYILAAYCFMEPAASLFDSFSIAASQELGMDNKWSSLMKALITDIRAGRCIGEVQDLMSMPNKNDLVIADISKELNSLSSVNDLKERYDKLILISEKYQEYEPKISFYLKPLIKKYAFLYKQPLPQSESEDKDNNTLEYFKIINEYTDYTPKELTEALNHFSNYSILKSKFYAEYSEDVSLVVFDIYNKLHGDNFFLKHFGNGALYPYYIFKTAILEDEFRDELTKTTVLNSNWQMDYYNAVFHKKNKIKIIDGILKSIDSIMRSQYGYPKLIEKPKIFKKYEDIVLNEINKFCTDNMKINSHVSKMDTKIKSRIKNKSKIEPVPQPVEIDVSKLDDIRLSAESIQEKLIIDELIPEAPEPKPDVKALRYQTESKDAGQNTQLYNTENKTLLSEIQILTIKALLENNISTLNILINKNGLMLTIIIDDINELLFEQIQDNCIEFDGDRPYIVEDYFYDLKGMINL